MKILVSLLGLVLALGTVAVAQEPAEEKKADPKIELAVDPDAMVVKVNDKVITEKDVAAEVEKRIAAQAKRMPPGMEINERMRSQIRSGVVDMMVEQALIQQKANAMDIEVADEQVTKEIEEIAKQQNLKMEDVPAEIAKFGMTMEDLKGQIRMKLQVDALIDKAMKEKDVTEEEVKKFYEDNPQYFEQPEKARVAHVLIMTQNKSDEEKAAAKEKIEDILKKAKAGEDFAQLAKENSEDPGSKDKGGEYTFPRGQMVPAFEEAAFTLKDGEISGVIETEYGYHVLKKLEHFDAKKQSFDEVKDQIKSHLERQQRGKFWDDYRKTMKEEAKIEYSEAETKLRQATAQPPMPMMPPPPQPETKPEPKQESKPAEKPAEPEKK